MNNETLNQVFSSTANSIRTKLGSTDKITPTDFASQISTIQADVITVENISDIDVTKLDPNKRYLVFKENWSNLDGDFKGDCEVRLPLLINFPELDKRTNMLSIRIKAMFSDVQGSFNVYVDSSGEVTSSHGEIVYRRPFEGTNIFYEFTYDKENNRFIIEEAQKYFWSKEDNKYVLDSSQKYTYDEENNRFILDNGSYASEPVHYIQGISLSTADKHNLVKYHKNNTYLGVYTAKYNYSLLLKSNLNNIYTFIFAADSLGYYNNSVYYIFDFIYNEDKLLTQYKMVQISSDNDRTYYYKSGSNLYAKSSLTKLYTVYQITLTEGVWTSSTISSTNVNANTATKINDINLSTSEYIFFNQMGTEPMNIYTSASKSSIFTTSKQFESFVSNPTLEKLIENS